MKLRYLLIILAILTFKNVNASTITGHLQDMDNHQYIENVSIIIYTQEKAQQVVAVTDSNGKYTLSIPKQWLDGEYFLTITHKDYYTVNGVVLVKDGQVRNFYMKKKHSEVEATIEEEENKEETETQRKDILPTSNIVFLIDVSSSMNYEDKIDNLKVALKHLTSLLRDSDKVSIVTYSTEAKVHMQTTSGIDKDKIYNSIDNLICGGATMGGLGLDLAYKVAKNKYDKEENNKIILVTDGAFTSTKTRENKSMDRLIRKMYSEQIALSVFSFGTSVRPKTKDNLKKLSDLGGGHYAHIEDEVTAKEEMVNEAKSIGVFNTK